VLKLKKNDSGAKRLKAEDSPLHTMKVYRGSGGTAPLMLYLATRWG